MFVHKMLQQAVNMYRCTNVAGLVANSIEFFATAARTDAPLVTSSIVLYAAELRDSFVLC